MKTLYDYLLYTYRLKNVVRYNTRMRIKDETVAEHSFYVALFSLKICDDNNLPDDIKLACLIKSLLHDMPEIELNDITHDVKEKLNLRGFLKTYEDKYYSDNYQQYESLMTKSQGIVDSIVNLADTWSVLQYVIHEKNLGNSSKDTEEIYTETLYRVSALKSELNTKLEEYKNEKL